MSSDQAIEVRNCRRRLRGRNGRDQMFQLDNFHVPRGARLALTGPSGCGKSTLLHLISGLLRPDSGSIRVGGEEVTSMPPARLDRFRGGNIGMVHQTFHLLEGFSALENVMMGLRFGARSRRHEIRARAEDCLREVGLERQLAARPSELSVGERQRVAIARALAGEPRVLLADEPTGSLDPKTANDVFDLLLEKTEAAECTLLLVTHDLDLAARLPDRFDGRELVLHVEASDR